MFQMLPSMPILFTRDSQDAFGNKIEPSTSFFGQKNAQENIIKETPIATSFALPPRPSPVPKETKTKQSKKKESLIQDQPVTEENQEENELVSAYISKVQAKFASNPRVPNNKFLKFKEFLKSYDPNKETPIDLFKKVEGLFGEESKDLSNEFLMFLTQGQACQIGRFMDQSLQVHLSSFVVLLKNTFSRKPAMLKKVLRAINNSLKCGTMEEMKNKVLPHLRSNPQLALMYKSLFPSERPPNSLYENNTDFASESFLTEDKGYDVWQFEDNADDNRRNLNAKENLDTVYVQGRVFMQCGRAVRPARVAFPYSKEPYRVEARRLAPHCRLSPSQSDEEEPPKTKTTPKRTKKTTKPPKNIKDVNDNTKPNVDSPKAKKAKRNPTKKDQDTQKKEKKESSKKDSLKEVEPTAKKAKVESKKVEVKNGSWTREEDKTMLQVLKGEPGSDQVFLRINQMLPHRSVTEIKERFFHVMTLLKQMGVAEMT